MSWNESKEFGVIKVNGKSVNLYKSTNNYTTITLNEEVKDARWAGDTVIVYLMNGKVRRYTSINNYTTV